MSLRTITVTSGRAVAGPRESEAAVGLARTIATLLFVVSIPVALVTTNVRILANEGRLYEYAFDHYDAPATTGLARSELIRAGEELRDYFNNDDEIVYIRVEEGGREVPLFSPRETAHLRDVKNLFRLTFRVQELSVVYALAYVVGVFIWAREASFRALARQTLAAGLMTTAAILALGAVALAGFDRAFEQFHLISFSNELWKLNPRTDHLIQMFPEDFWFDASMIAGIMALVEAGVLALGAVLYLAVARPGPLPALAVSRQQA